MRTTIEQAINLLAKNPRNLFLIDALGALLTCILQFTIGMNFSNAFGLPISTFNILASIAALFFLYSMSCFLYLKGNRAAFIQLICTANLLYVALTLALIIIHYSTVSTLGLCYFVGETIIIGLLAYVEMKVAVRVGQ